ncbi:MAG: secretion protein F [Lachnospiraceae bacterium]
MQYLILMLFAALLALGVYFIMAFIFKVPTYKQTKAIISMGKVKKKKAKNSDAFIMDLASKLSRFITIEEHRKRKLTSILTSAEIPMTAEVYLAQAYVKTGLILLAVIPCLLIIPILSPVFVIIAIAIYFSETTKAETIIKAKREDIEYELPRFVATLTQSLAASRDLKLILETYTKNAGPSMKNELMITTADMGTGNYQSALTRWDTRVSSGMLSQVIAGLQAVVNGDDGVAHFKMLSHDMKQLELQRLKKLALERPPKIRKYSFFLLGCMLMMYLGVMGYQIIGAMSGMF